MAKPKLTKKVKVLITYECGRCGNVQVRPYESEDGLLVVPKVYCGHCVRFRRGTMMTETVSQAEAFEVEPEQEEANAVPEPVSKGSKNKRGSNGTRRDSKTSADVPEQSSGG